MNAVMCAVVMAGLDPAIHALMQKRKDVDARDKRGPDAGFEHRRE
jgi:hypothetical protein